MILTVIAASLLVYSWKIIGYLIPERFLTPKVKSFTERVTLVLLAALVVTQTLASNGEWAFDARIPAVLVAGVLLWLRAPFIVVVIAAAAVAAGLRYLGF
jgi:branched-subunit amino acid transport protein